MKITLDMQIRAVDRALGIALRHGLHSEDAEAIGKALKTLAWLDANVDFVREVWAIEQDEVVKSIRATFPGSKLVAVRRVVDGTEEDHEARSDEAS